MSVSILAASLVLACQPAQVIDGATLRCEGQLVRLVATGAGGPEQTEALVRLVGNDPVICRAEGPAGEGPVVARCWVRGEDLGCSTETAGPAADRDRNRRVCR